MDKEVKKSCKLDKKDKEVKKSCKLDKKDWIKKKCCEAQAAADRNDTRMLYSVVMTGVHSNSNVPVKSKDGRMLLTEEEQNARWMEHFKEVLNQPESTIELDMDNSDASEELEVNMTDITDEEVTRAINSLTNNKAPGIDEISAEMLKHGTDSITGQLVVLCNSIWREQECLTTGRKK